MKNNDTTIKYVVYCRKSTESEDRQTLSLDDQKRELDELIKREGLNVVKSFAGKKGGESQSAHKRGRPIFGEVMEFIESGRANGLLVWHPNRIARNAYDGGLVITLMDEGKIVEIKTPTKAYHNNPDDKFWLALEFNMAKKSSDDNSVVVKRGLRTKLQMGWCPGYAPLGYLNTKNYEEKGQNKILKDSERFDMIKQMWNLMLTGNYTPPQILKIANKDWKFKTRPSKENPGGRPLSRSGIYRIFTNPFYYGYFEYGKTEWVFNGKKKEKKPKPLYKGSHEPMITEEDFDIVQRLLGRKGRPRSKTHRFAFTGLMRCGNCGAMITAEEKIKHQKNGNIHHYVYYRCTKRKDENCPEKAVDLKDLNSQIDEAVSKLSIDEDFRNLAIQYLHEVRKEEAQGNEAIFANKQKALIQNTKQLDSLFIRFTSPENSEGQLISEEEYLSHKQNLLKLKATLEDELKAQGKAIEDWVEASEKTFNFARYARIWFAKGDLDTRRAIFACLGSHLIIKDQKLNISLRESFTSLFESADVAKQELVKVRTSLGDQNSLLKKENLALVLRDCPTWRRGRDSPANSRQHGGQAAGARRAGERTRPPRPRRVRRGRICDLSKCYSGVLENIGIKKLRGQALFYIHGAFFIKEIFAEFNIFYFISSDFIQFLYSIFISFVCDNMLQIAVNTAKFRIFKFMIF